MKYIYLVLAILGFLIPNTFVFIESYESGNLLLWSDPMATINGMFDNLISTAFSLDLIMTAITVMLFMVIAGHRAGMKNLWVYPVLAILFGLGGPLPFFLYMREAWLEKHVQAGKT